MKFLFDQSADFGLIPHLRELGHDVSAISLRGDNQDGCRIASLRNAPGI